MHHLGGQPTVRSVTLFGVINILALLKPWCTMIEQGDTTRPAVVSTEQGDTTRPAVVSTEQGDTTRPAVVSTEQGDTTRPAVVSTEPSETVKEYEKKQHTNVIFSRSKKSNFTQHIHREREHAC